MFKKLSLITLLSLNTTAFASPYLGAQVGLLANNYNASQWSSTINTSINNHKFAGRAYLGYEVNKYLSTEIGYTYYNKTTFKNKDLNAKKGFYQNGVDLTGIISLPLPVISDFSVHGKAGVTDIFRGKLVANEYLNNHASSNKITWLSGIGLSYNINPSFTTNFDITRTFQNKDLPRSDLYTLGLTYKFNI